MKEKYERKTKENRPVVAICYDFDKTLSPDDMQAQGYIQSVGLDIKQFWEESNGLAEENDMDQNLAYMYKMIKEAEGNFVFNREKLREYGAKVKLFQGVEDWFERIRQYGEREGVIVEHYIISSGLKEMIEGTKMAQENAFTKIYASSFFYNDRGVAEWPAQVINYTNKTQFLFRIEKGVLNVNDQGVNEYFTPDKIRVPFRNMIYIGDSDTDIPCMKLVNSYGGYSIGVYNPDNQDKTKVYRMIRDNRINLFASADYREGSELDVLVKMIIDKTSANEKLVQKNMDYQNEVKTYDLKTSNSLEENQKSELIGNLASSASFKYTHLIIEKLARYTNWTMVQKETLLKIAVNNHQVQWILNDDDVKSFYNLIIKDMSDEKNVVKEIKKIMEEFDDE